MDNLSPKSKQEAIFIYNAVKDGWTVRMKDDGTFELIKNKERLNPADLTKDTFIDEYITKYLTINMNK